MQLLYNSDTFAVVLFGAEGVGQGSASPATGADAGTAAAAAVTAFPAHGGYEIVDKLARKEIYLQGLVAASFQRGVKALVEQGPDPQALEDYIASFAVLAQHPVFLH